MVQVLTPLAWYWPALGGLLIGIAAGVFLLANGRVMGISGMVASALGLARGNDRTAAVLFLIATMIGANVAHRMMQGGAVVLAHEWPVVIVGGLLVGYGTRLGSGCTSGHGVCGLARLSPRSLWAAAVFMTTAAATVYVIRHVLGQPI